MAVRRGIMIDCGSNYTRSGSKVRLALAGFGITVAPRRSNSGALNQIKKGPYKGP